MARPDVWDGRKMAFEVGFKSRRASDHAQNFLVGQGQRMDHMHGDACLSDDNAFHVRKLAFVVHRNQVRVFEVELFKKSHAQRLNTRHDARIFLHGRELNHHS